MNSNGCTYRFIESSLSLLSKDIDYDITIRQQPIRAKMSVIHERDRRPIEPPPIIQIHWNNCTDDELKLYLQSPFYFVVIHLVTENDPETPLVPTEDYLSGSTVSSLHRLRDIDNSDGGFFIFGDLAVKREGTFKLRFSLFEIIENQVQNRKTILSDTFTVFTSKQFPGPVEPTFLSRAFSDQGVKMRIRKEHKLHIRKRKLDNNETNTIKKRQQKKTTEIVMSSPPYAEPSTSDVFFGRWQAIVPYTSIEPAYSSRHRQERYLSSPENSLDIPRPPLSKSSLPSLAKYHTENNQVHRLPTPPSLHDSQSSRVQLPPLRTIINNSMTRDHPSSFRLPPPPSFYR